jgi:hypothetical protein
MTGAHKLALSRFDSSLDMPTGGAIKAEGSQPRQDHNAQNDAAIRPSRQNEDSGSFDNCGSVS